MKYKRILFPLVASLAMLLTSCAKSQIDVLIIDGQNNHPVWPKSTMMMKQYLEETGKFRVDVARTVFTWKGAKWLPSYPLNDGRDYQDLPEPKTDPDYAPNFSKYDVVISNFGYRAADWPAATQAAFESYVSAGGGFVAVHAANNSFPDWLEYNRMTGLGGWGGRDERHGPYVYFDESGERVRDSSKGPGGAHGKRHEFLVTMRESHPITDGMPGTWMHTRDECYDRLRGPAENLAVLATAWCSLESGGSGRHEPMLMTVRYGDGRVFNTTLGHDVTSLESVGFISTFLRGTEWAASGSVTLPVPNDFPIASEPSARSY